MTSKPTTIINLARAHLGDPYVFGAWGAPCTPELRKKYARLNPSHADAIQRKCPVLSGTSATCDGCKWQNALAYDCRGFTYWLLKQVGIHIDGGGATSQYNTASNWAERGAIAALPDVVCCLFRQNGSKMEHTGMHLGGGQVIHCSAGVQTGDVGQNWTHYAVPNGLYTIDELEKARKIDVRKTLKKGVRGDDVRELQTLLTACGFDAGAVDGIFGSATESAVRAFQAAQGLTVDGICGAATWTALGNQEDQPTDETSDNQRAKLEALRDSLENALAVLEEVLGHALG